jgi:hypothetical protein
LVSISERTFKPLRVFVLAIRLTITSWLISGRPVLRRNAGRRGT